MTICISSLLRPIKISSFPYPTLVYTTFYPRRHPPLGIGVLATPLNLHQSIHLYLRLVFHSPPILIIIITRYSSADIRYEELHNELMVRPYLILKKGLVIDGIKDAVYKRIRASLYRFKKGIPV